MTEIQACGLPGTGGQLVLCIESWARPSDVHWRDGASAKSQHQAAAGTGPSTTGGARYGPCAGASVDEAAKLTFPPQQ